MYPDEAVKWFQPEIKILISLVMVEDIQRMTDSSVRLVPKLKTWCTHKKVKKVNLVPAEHCKRNATGPHGDARPKKRPRPMPKKRTARASMDQNAEDNCIFKQLQRQAALEEVK